MSMLATFVQVDAGLLDDPSVVERLFMPELPGGVGFDSDKMRALILERGPQLLAGAIDLNPSLREMIEERVGTTHEGLRGGAGGDAVLKLMQERIGPPAGRGGAASGVHGELSLDKAWHGVHYLLSGAVEPTGSPLGQAVLGGTEVGEDFSGYGPARMFEPGQVATIASALGEPETERLVVERFDAARMSALQVYPFGWEDEDSREWLFVSFRDLKGFYADAAAEGWAVVTCLV
jgi:uncharacterized protein DUF1877